MPRLLWPDASSEPGKAERRLADRRRTMLIGSVLAADGVIHPCVVRNMSTTGARLSVPSGHIVEPRFDLVIHGKTRKRAFRVSLAWQKNGDVGVWIDAPR